MILAATPGDPAGIGAEIVWKTLKSGLLAELKVSLLCVGARKPFEKLGAPIIELDQRELDQRELAEGELRNTGAKLKPPRHPRGKPFVWLLPAPERSERFLEGFQSGWSIERATRLVQTGQARALVTGPISKERLNAGGYPFPGHTEFLAHLCRPSKTGPEVIPEVTPEVTMMLANELLRITLVTTHVAFKDVPQALTRAKLRRAVTHTVSHLHSWWGIRKPRVAIAALNPHAGESGLFGKEEIETIAPEIETLRKASRGRYELLGPLPADTLFANHALARKKDRFDAVVCMYHDQGLIPVKLLDFRNTVNVTLGLPIIRTSVDHGTAFDIAGTGKADPSSFRAALRLAAKLARRA